MKLVFPPDCTVTVRGAIATEDEEAVLDVGCVMRAVPVAVVVVVPLVVLVDDEVAETLSSCGVSPNSVTAV